MKSVLFVDDDRNVLNGLRDLLRPHRQEWEMEFVDSGEHALARLNERAFDVVVSDMRMPKMDGAALLKETRDHYPRTVRIVLSGQTEMDLAMKTISVAHQFLAKPCEANQLQEVIHRACVLSDLLNDEQQRSLVDGFSQLPSAPQTYIELNALLENQNAPLKEVAKIIERDVAMSAKVLQLVNSAFFGLPRRISGIAEAASYLGTLMIRNLALSMGAFATFRSQDPKVTAALETLRRHSVVTANIARSMFRDKRKADEAFMAGILHDVGHLILLSLSRSRPPKGPEPEAPADPARLGAYLLGLWGIPYPIVEAVAFQERPKDVERKRFDIPDAVHIAHRLAAGCFDVPGHDAAAAAGTIDPDYLQGLGITEAQLQNWRDLAQKIARDGSA